MGYDDCKAHPMWFEPTPPAPALPEEVIAETQKKYLEAYERLTGSALQLP